MQDQTQTLLNIALALNSQRNLDSLLKLILDQATKLLGADAGTIFLASPSKKPDHLIFQSVVNHSKSFSFKSFTVGINEQSLAGYVAVHKTPLKIDDVYHLPQDVPYRFNADFDQSTGYLSKSLLSVPMCDTNQNLIGVVQILNKLDAHKQAIPFAHEDITLLQALANQAAIAIENAKLYQDIESLFESFIQACVTAIESRDPTTSGHSNRVATLTLGLAREIHDIDHGRFRLIRFNKQNLKQIEYASLLHDFGKIGVRENVLTKANKLYPHELSSIMDRIELVRQHIEIEFLNQKINHLQNKITDFQSIENEKHLKIEKLNQIENLIVASNLPSILTKQVSLELESLAPLSFVNQNGQSTFVFTHDQLETLKIPKGSLSLKERKEIENHVSHTYEFLKKISWTDDLRRVPMIAYGHHEKLDGSGYPNNIKDETIPFEAKMMAIVDIFDALVASDRPYKKALEISKALDILNIEADQQKLDKDLVEVFVSKKVYRLTTS